MAEYVPPRYTDPNYLGFDDFEKQLLKRGIEQSYYEKALSEAAGEAAIKAANQQAFKWSEARRAVAEAMGTAHTVPAADVVVPQSAPGVVSSTGAKALASAARSTGAQSARVLKTAAEETALQLARNPKTVAGAIPIVGAAAVAVWETSGSRAAGRSWGDSVSRGIGASIGSTFGANLGGAGAAALSLNPIPTAVAYVGGAVAGERVGAGVGSLGWAGVTGKIPGTYPWLVGKVLQQLSRNLGFRGDDLPAENPAGQQQGIDTTTIPPFTGGQSPGVLYQISYNVDGQPVTGVIGAAPYGPISGLSRQTVPGPGPQQQASGVTYPGTANGAQIHLNLGGTTGRWIDTYSGAPQWQVTGLTITRADGQPDTGGDSGEGPAVAVPRAQPAARPNSPIYNPAPAQPGNTPPTSNPAQPSAPTAPGDLEDDDKQRIPPPLPDGSPAQSPIPTITPQPVTPSGSPSEVPNQSNSTNPARSGDPSGATDTPELDTNKDTDTIKIQNPEDSGQTFKINGHPDLKPGETIELEDTDGNRAIARAIYAALAGAIVGGGIIAARKVADLSKNGTSTQPVEPPTPTPPQNPTDTGCRCNGPIMSKLDDFEKKLGLNNIVSGAGDGSVMAYLIKMQTFAEKAWEMTRMQKVLDLLTFVGVMHNVSMLSRDVGETFFYVIGQALDIVGIDNEDGSQLDVGSIIGTSLDNYIRAVMGDAFVDGARASYQRANRIVQSASMVIWTVRSIADASQDLSEWIAESTGKIGNALKRFGVVGERSYPWMAENAKAQHKLRNRFSKLTDTLERAEDTASSISVATSNVLEIQQETNELTESWQAFKTSLNAEPDPWFSNEPVGAAVAAEVAASPSPDLTRADAEKRY